MENSKSGMQLLAIIVGGSPEEFVRHTERLLGDYEIESVLCENIYSAVSELAKNRDRDILVFGRIERLGRENGRFFEKAKQAAACCCCLAERYSYDKRKQISQTENADAVVINNRADVEKVMAEFLTDRSALPAPKKENSKTAGFNSSQFAATKEEIDALLEA